MFRFVIGGGGGGGRKGEEEEEGEVSPNSFSVFKAQFVILILLLDDAN